MNISVLIILLVGTVVSGCASVQTEKPEEDLLEFDADTYYEFGNFFYQKKDYEGAAYRLNVAANKDHSAAQSLLGQMYLHGTPATPINNKIAYKWLVKSSEANDSTAQFNLGYMYSNGVGVKKDYTKAIEWYRRSAEQGHASAQMSLAVSYLSGTGVEKSIPTGCSWIGKSIESNSVFAKKILNSDDPTIKALITQCPAVAPSI